ncbi:MAG TPA: hypothetical protein PKK06_18170 [Phycisphaerae bacterium]|nr:hypothetical protein [Phycisphaerae bacterium]
MVVEPRWRFDREPLVQEAVDCLSDCVDDLVEVLLKDTGSLREAAYECLALMPLPEAIVARLENIVACGTDDDQVAWSLWLLAHNEHADALPRHFIERALSVGEITRGVAISVIPYVDADDDALEHWLLEVFEQGDESECMRVINTGFAMSKAFGTTILERACGDARLKLVSEGLYFVWYAELDRNWTAAVIRRALERWPAEESVLRPALYCIKDRHLQEFEDFVVPLIHHKSAGIAMQAAQALAALSPSRAEHCLTEGAARLHEAVREVLRSCVRDSPGGEEQPRYSGQG